MSEKVPDIEGLDVMDEVLTAAERRKAIFDRMMPELNPVHPGYEISRARRQELLEEDNE